MYKKIFKYDTNDDEIMYKTKEESKFFAELDQEDSLSHGLCNRLSNSIINIRNH